MDKNRNSGIYEKYIKRAVDIVISLFVLILFWWVYVIVAILVKVRLGSPVIFSHERPGMIEDATGKEKIFKLYKFRSMTDERDENGKLLPGNLRLTKFGRVLRATSLDELPEIWNILKGDMSLIGPRPLAMEYLPYYTDEERERHSVRPGLTGFAQANGRNNLTWEEKFAYDREYVNNISFLMDVKIILKTVKSVLIKEGIGQGEQSPVSFHIYREKQLAERSVLKNE